MASLELLEGLASVIHVGHREQETTPSRSNIVSLFLKWERAIWSKSREKEQDRILELRKIITHGSVITYKKHKDFLIAEVLELTHIVVDRID